MTDALTAYATRLAAEAPAFTPQQRDTVVSAFAAARSSGADR